MTRILPTIMLILLLAPSARATVDKEATAAAIPYGVIDQQLLKTAYVDGEQMRYDVFWTGGVKIGELSLEIKRIKGMKTATHQVKTVITTQLGDMLGFPKSLLVNFAVKRVKKMVPPFSLPGAVRFNDALAAGRSHRLAPPPPNFPPPQQGQQPPRWVPPPRKK